MTTYVGAVHFQNCSFDLAFRYFPSCYCYSYCVEFDIMAFWTNLTHYCIVSDKGTLTNSADPDQTQQNVASNQGLHCL